MRPRPIYGIKRIAHATATTPIYENRKVVVGWWIVCGICGRTARVKRSDALVCGENCRVQKHRNKKKASRKR